MTNKWKDLIDIAGGTAIVGSEVAWTVFLTSAASKIPIVGIPIAAILGVTGAGTTVYLANGLRFLYKDWRRDYC